MFCLISWETNKVSHWNFVHWYSIKYRIFLWKNHAENVHQKLAPEPFLILLNNPKQRLHAGNSSENKKFWKMIIKKTLKKSTLFFLLNPVHFNDKVIKNKRSLELGSSHSSGYETSSEKFLYSLYIIWRSLMM